MDISIVIIVMGLLVLFSHIFNALFVKTRLPNVLLLMLIGLFIGPILNLVSPDSLGTMGSVFTTITLITILFDSGTGLDLGVLRKSLGSATWLTILNFLCMTVLGGLIGHYVLSMDWITSLYMGAALGGTSSAVIIPLLNQLKPGSKANMILLLESTLSDVLCLTVGMALLSLMQSGNVSIGKVFGGMALSIVLAIVFGFLLGALWLIVLKKYLAGMKNIMFTSFAIAFIIYGVCEELGLNGGLAILSYGITMGNISRSKFVQKQFRINEDAELNQNERDFFSEVAFLLQTYFFVYIGISIRLDNPWHLIVGLVFVILAFYTRPLTTKTLGSKDLSLRDKKIISSLGAKGLIAAVLATLPLEYAYKYTDENELPRQVVSEVANMKMRDEMPWNNVPAVYRMSSAYLYDYELLDETSSAVYAEKMETAVDMVYRGKTTRNVSYAVVLFSIILCSLLVMYNERRNI